MTVTQSEARRLDPAESTLSLPAHPAASSSKTVRRSISFKRLRSRSVHRQQTRDRQTEEVPCQTAALRPPLPSAAHSAQGRLEGAATVPTSSSPPQPFDWPKSSQYCACYCEENAYLLAQSLLRKVERRHGKERVDAEGRKWDVWVVVVSNQGKTVLLWQQRASTSALAAHPVVWDYHVFPIVTATQQSLAGDVKEQKMQENGQKAIANATATSGQVTAPQHPASSQSVKGASGSRANSFFWRRKPLAPTAPASAGFVFGDVVIPAPSASSILSSSGWQGWVYDMDSVLCHPTPVASPDGSAGPSVPTPVPFSSYVAQTFGDAASTPKCLLPTFRLVRAEAWLDNFSSDRSHMLLPSRNLNGSSAEQQYSIAPPPWSPIVGPRARRKGWTNNLMRSWVDMSTVRFASAPSEEAEADAELEELTPADMKVQFGKVLDRDHFFKGAWEMAEWKRSESAGKGRKGRKSAAVVVREEQPPSIERVTSYHRRHRARQRSASEPEKQGNAVDDEAGAGAGGAVRGGRVTSPLFPAYLHDVLQARATRKRESYLALKVAAAESDGGVDARMKASRSEEPEPLS